MTPAMVGRSFTTEIQRVELFIANRLLSYLNEAETFSAAGRTRPSFARADFRLQAE